MNKAGERLINGLAKENPTFVLMLGMCPTLAVTTSAMNGLGMGLTTMVVLALSNLMISLLRKIIPNRVRIPAFIVIIASFVTAVQLLLEGYLPDLNKSLGVYIPLIVVNCIILGRAESYAYSNPPVPSLFDGIGMGLGFTVALTCIGAVRELLGAGELFGASVMPASFVPIRIFGQAPGAFFVLAALVAIQNLVKESLKKRGKPYEKIGSGCSEDCMNCSDTGCTRRFYDNTEEEKAPSVTLKAAVAPKEEGEIQKDDGEIQKEDGGNSMDDGENSKDDGENSKDDGQSPKVDGEISRDNGVTSRNEVKEGNKERKDRKGKDANERGITDEKTVKKRKSSNRNDQNDVKNKAAEKAEKPDDSTVTDEDSSYTRDKNAIDRKSVNRKSEDRKSANRKSADLKSEDRKPQDRKPQDRKPQDQKTEDQKPVGQDRGTQAENTKTSAGKKASSNSKRSNKKQKNNASENKSNATDATKKTKIIIPIEEDEDVEILDLGEEE